MVLATTGSWTSTRPEVRSPSPRRARTSSTKRATRRKRRCPPRHRCRPRSHRNKGARSTGLSCTPSPLTMRCRNSTSRSCFLTPTSKRCRSVLFHSLPFFPSFPFLLSSFPFLHLLSFSFIFSPFPSSSLLFFHIFFSFPSFPFFHTRLTRLPFCALHTLPFAGFLDLLRLRVSTMPLSHRQKPFRAVLYAIHHLCSPPPAPHTSSTMHGTHTPHMPHQASDTTDSNGILFCRKALPSRGLIVPKWSGNVNLYHRCCHRQQ